MIRSMTGFGKASVKSPYGTITVELKTLNNKSLSISYSTTEGMFLLEEDIKEVMEKKIYRGKVYAKVTRENPPKGDRSSRVEVNKAAAKEYAEKIRRMQKALGLKGEITISDIISLPGVIEVTADRKEEKYWPFIKKALEKALDNLMEYRVSEGKRLAKDFKKRLSGMTKALKEIKKYEKQSVEAYREKLLKSIKEISDNNETDKGRIEQEVAIFARNCDIAEEVTRLGSHVEAYVETIDKANHDVGKKLDFVAQEMHREANTIGSKANDVRISNAVIEIKSEIDRMREQIKNIE
ncbi:MAG: YicC family protein [Candidatus Omnitrophica bacterium]|nr:YicC family protein [Candidatus Omnitrophota bacterium]